MNYLQGFYLQGILAKDNGTNESRNSRMDQTKFVEDSLSKMWSDMVCLGRPYHFEFFKDYLPQILPGPFLNNLTQIPYMTYALHNSHFWAKMPLAVCETFLFLNFVCIQDFLKVASTLIYRVWAENLHYNLMVIIRNYF